MNYYAIHFFFLSFSRCAVENYVIAINTRMRLDDCMPPLTMKSIKCNDNDVIVGCAIVQINVNDDVGCAVYSVSRTSRTLYGNRCEKCNPHDRRHCGDLHQWIEFSISAYQCVKLTDNYLKKKLFLFWISANECALRKRKESDKVTER